MKVWDGIEMIVDPAEGIGGNLAFIPQLFDPWEREVIREYAPAGGTFVDVGANQGSYALWAARCVGPSGTVLAYEAEPTNFASLLENIAINESRQIQAFHVGVSDKVETLRLRMNPTGNSGGHSFLPEIHGEFPEQVEVQCRPLDALLEESAPARVDFMKLDIEGFEPRVLTRFFAAVPPSSALRPRYILTELFDGDARGPGTLWTIITAAGYEFVKRRDYNALFVRT